MFNFKFIIRLLFAVFLIGGGAIVYVLAQNHVNLSAPDLVQLTNEERQKNGLRPLMVNMHLFDAAEFKAEDMAKYHYFAHVSPRGVEPWDFMKVAGYHYCFAGENLADGFTQSQAVMDAWMNSPEHKKNILQPEFDQVAIVVKKVVINNEETYIVVQEFGSSQC